MRTRLGVVLACALLVAAEPADDAVKAEKGRLKGTWVVQSFDDGEEPVGKVKGATVRFDGDKVFMTLPGAKEQEGTYAIEPSKKPKQIDLTSAPPGEEKMTARGVYELDGDALKIRFGAVGIMIDGNGKKTVIPSVRPKSLDAKEGVLMVLKREKKKQPPVRSLPAGG